MGNKKYFAFISYSHKDSEMAKWLQHEFEYYELPAKLFEERKDLRKEDLPESFRPVFRDEDELSGGELKPQISEALADSEYLIVVCSPNSAQSVYVDSEIKEFISLSQKNRRRIFPFIVDGKPHQDDDNKEKECFPKSLLELSEDNTDPIELIAGDIHATGRDHAFVKILSGTLNEKDIRFADLWNRYAIEKAEKERKEREDKERLQIAQSRFIAEKAKQLIEEGDSYMARLLALKVLPKNLKDPDRPYVAEVENVLRLAVTHNSAILRGHKSDVKDAIFSPNGEYVLSFSKDETIRLWRVKDGMCIRTYECNADLVSFLRDVPNRFVSVRSIGIKELKIWEFENKKAIDEKRLKLYADSLCFSNDGQYLIATKNDELRIWLTSDGSLTKTIKNEIITDIRTIAISPDNQKIACGFKDHLIKVLDIETEMFILTLKGHIASVDCLAFSENGKYLASSSWATILLWNVTMAMTSSQADSIFDKYREITNKGVHNDKILSLSFNPNGTEILSSSRDNTITIWDIDTKEYRTLKGHLYEVNSARYNSDDSLIVSASSDKTVHLWDCCNNSDFEIIPLDSSMYAYKVSFSPDRNFVAALDDKVIKIWNVNTGKCQKSLEGHEKLVTSVSYSSDGKRLITTSLDNTVRIWDVDTENTCILDKDKELQEMAIFSDDGKYVATASGTIIKLWEAKEFGDNTPKPIKEFVCENPIAIASFICEENTVVVIDMYGNICEWELFDDSDSECTQTNIYAGTVVEGQMEICHNGELISFIPGIGDIHDQNIYLWNRKKKTMKTLKGHKDSVLFANFNLSGNLLVSASEDKTVKIWDVESGICLKTYYGHTDTVVGAAFVKEDSQSILSISRDRTIMKWKFPSLQKIIDDTQKRFEERELTEEECKLYYLE